MQEQDAVIILRKGKEQIIFPGSKGYKIQWSAGTRQLPLTVAPSGHLVIECEHFEGARKTHDGDTLTFVTDHSSG